MATYPATNDYASLVATDPLGTYPPSDLDDALRETRLVAKTVNAKGHTSAGLHRYAVAYSTNTTLSTALGNSVSASNTWYRVPLAVYNDLTSLLGAADYTNCIKPIAGTYLLNWGVSFYKTDFAIASIRLGASATIDNTTSTNITGLSGAVAFSNNAAGYATAKSTGCGIYVSDGTANLGLEYCVQVRNATDGHRAAGSGAFQTATGAIEIPWWVSLQLINHA